MKELRKYGPHSEGHVWHIPISRKRVRYYDPNADEIRDGRRYLSIRLAFGSPYVKFAFTLQVTVQVFNPDAVNYRDRFKVTAT